MADNNLDDFSQGDETLDESLSGAKNADLSEGTRVHRYLILQLIGKGGMGAVYRAYDPELDRRIAIKILTVSPQEGETASLPQARLIREAQALAKLSHPNVVSVFDVGTHEDGVYIAMEYVEGKTLRDWVAEDNPTQAQILAVMQAAGQGLQSAHSVGIVHRDFKPDNMLVGNAGEVKVLDFGLAKGADFENLPIARTDTTNQLKAQSGEHLLSQRLTQVGTLIGTIAYMAPEHFFKEELDEKTDQFSFCVTLFEALYGTRPFSGSSREAYEEKITCGRFDFPKEVNVPAWIQAIIQKGLAVSKADRFESIAALLEALADDPQLARAQKRKRWLLVLSFVVGAVMFFCVGYLFFDRAEVCAGAEHKLAAFWNDEVKAALKHAFGETKLSYANDSYQRVEKRFGDYLQNWKTQYTECCLATRVHGEQSEEIMDLKMGCLNRCLMNAKALARVFAHADKVVVEKSIQAVQSLTSLTTCNDVESLRSKIPVPPDEQTKQKVASLREKLAEVEAFKNTGKYHEGLELVQKLKPEILAVAYQPLEAQMFYWLGLLLDRVGEYKKAETTLNEAALKAGESRDGTLACRALVLLVPVVGYVQMRHDEGLLIARYAQVLLGVVGAQELTRSMLQNNMALVYWSKNEHDKALAYLLKALVIRERVLGPEHPVVASTLNNMGIVYSLKGNNEKALEHFQRALEINKKVLGPGHPEVAGSLNNMGVVYSMQGQHAKALEYLRAALVIKEKVLGLEHPVVAGTLSRIGTVLIDMGKPQDALEPLRRTLQICEKMTCQADPHAQALFGLARALRATNDMGERAIELAKQARELLASSPQRFGEELTKIDTWLQQEGRLRR